jgi:hypothetical protein
LFRKVLHHNPRDICRVGQKGSEETNRAKLNGIPQPIVSAPVRGDLGSVFVVYEEILGELRRCRIAIVAAVPSRLLRREKVYGHFKSSPQKPIHSSPVRFEIRGRRRPEIRTRRGGSSQRMLKIRYFDRKHQCN